MQLNFYSSYWCGINDYENLGDDMAKEGGFVLLYAYHPLSSGTNYPLSIRFKYNSASLALIIKAFL
jgi:hypothetical protein